MRRPPNSLWWAKMMNSVLQYHLLHSSALNLSKKLSVHTQSYNCVHLWTSRLLHDVLSRWSPCFWLGNGKAQTMPALEARCRRPRCGGFANLQGSSQEAEHPLTNQNLACQGTGEAKRSWRGGKKMLASLLGNKDSLLQGCPSWRSLEVCFPSSKVGKPKGWDPRSPAETHSTAGAGSSSEKQKQRKTILIKRQNYWDFKEDTA